jgi:spermidine synthase
VRDVDPAQFTASVYGANTAGAIAGALAFTFLFVPLLGSQGAQRVMIGGSALACLLALAPTVWPPWASWPRMLRAAALAGFLLLAAGLASGVPPAPGELIAFGRSLAYRLGVRDPRTGERIPLPRLLYAGEGLNESVAVTDDGHARLFHVSGKIEASTAAKDMKLQRMLGLVPALARPEARSVLIVGFGAGVTAGTFVDCPGIRRIVICELEPLIPKRIAPWFADANHAVVSDPRTQIVYDDARHFLLTTKEHFDIITSDPIHPWVKGSAVLYSREYFQLVRDHLNPGGVVSQWAPLYQSSTSTIRSEVATFMSAFPEGTLWANLENGRGYDLVFLGSAERPRLDLDGIATRLARPDHAALVHSMQEVGYPTWVDLLYTYAGRNRELAPWYAGAVRNTDGNLRLQYQAGLESLVEDEADIYSEIERYRSFPTDLFVGSPEHVNALLAKGGQ